MSPYDFWAVPANFWELPQPKFRWADTTPPTSPPLYRPDGLLPPPSQGITACAPAEDTIHAPGLDCPPGGFPMLWLSKREELLPCNLLAVPHLRGARGHERQASMHAGLAKPPQAAAASADRPPRRATATARALPGALSAAQHDRWQRPGAAAARISSRSAAPAPSRHTERLPARGATMPTDR